MSGSDVRFPTEPVKEADADSYCKNMPTA